MTLFYSWTKLVAKDSLIEKSDLWWYCLKRIDHEGWFLKGIRRIIVISDFWTRTISMKLNPLSTMWINSLKPIKGHIFNWIRLKYVDDLPVPVALGSFLKSCLLISLYHWSHTSFPINTTTHHIYIYQLIQV